jgi:hypothetical protein
MGGSARPEGRLLSLRREGHQRIAQCLGLLGHDGDLALAVLRFVGIEALLDVSAAVLQQALDQSSQLVGRCCDGFGGTETRLHPPQEGPSGTLRVRQTAGRKA